MYLWALCPVVLLYHWSNAPCRLLTFQWWVGAGLFPLPPYPPFFIFFFSETIPWNIHSIYGGIDINPHPTLP